SIGDAHYQREVNFMNKSIGSFACIAFVTAVATCAQAAGAGITNGLDDNDSDPGVVIVHSSNSGSSCTGTYIGPHTVLTAAHCLSKYDLLHPLQVSVYRGGEISWPAVKIIAATEMAMGQSHFRPEAFYETNDIALVRTEHAASPTAI